MSIEQALAKRDAIWVEYVATYIAMTSNGADLDKNDRKARSHAYIMHEAVKREYQKGQHEASQSQPEAAKDALPMVSQVGGD